MLAQCVNKLTKSQTLSATVRIKIHKSVVTRPVYLFLHRNLVLQRQTLHG